MKLIRLTLVAALAAFSLAGCKAVDEYASPFDNVVYIDLAEKSASAAVTFNNTIEERTEELSAVLAYPSDADVNVGFRVDASLVQDYNRVHGTSYAMLDAKYFALSSESSVIRAGTTVSEPVEVSFTTLTELDIDVSYLVPVTISSADGVKFLDGSRTVWFVVKRSSAITKAAYLGDGNWINFPTLDEPGEKSAVFNGLGAVTYECLVRFDDWEGHKDISSVMGVEQYCLLRIGDANYNRKQIQFDGSGNKDKLFGPNFGKFPEKDNSKSLEAGAWYHIACTYDQTTRVTRIYLNGKIQSEGTNMGPAAPAGPINLAMRAILTAPGGAPIDPAAYQFFIGRSYDESRAMRGTIAEARVWSVARTPEQIWEYMYDVPDPENAEGLVGYWKFNEGQGNTVKDWSGNGNDGVAEIDLVWPSGIEIPVMNVE